MPSRTFSAPTVMIARLGPSYEATIGISGSFQGPCRVFTGAAMMITGVRTVFFEPPTTWKDALKSFARNNLALEIRNRDFGLVIASAMRQHRQVFMVEFER